MNGKSAKKGLVPALFAAVTAAILVAAVVSICVGKYSITVDDIRAIFAGKEVDDMTRRVFLTLRLSRTIMAIIAGVGLGVAGSVYQIIFKNPLASPDIIGIAVGRGQGEGHTLPRGNGCGLGLRCKRRRGFQNDAALHRRGCRGGGTACQQNQHGKDKHQAAQVEHILSEKSVFYIIIQNTPERKPPGVWMRKKLSR